MNETRIKYSEVKPRKKGDNLDEQDNYTELIQKYSQLNNENQNLIEENKVLKKLILEKQDYNSQSSIKNDDNILISHLKIKRSFYIQIVLGLLVIILSLGFHIVYLAVTDCLLYNEGNPDCWIKSWLGINLHASLFIDLFLYALIFIQSLLIILIIRSKINEVRLKNQKKKTFLK
ncbi:MAG: hypothetical protein ACFE9T_08775 [Promethearchaeota archaeon]